MSSGIKSLTREILAKALGGDVRAVRAFEQEAANNADTAAVAASTAAATDTLNDATVLVLSPNTAFNNERVLKLGPGLKATDDGTFLTITSSAPRVQGGFVVNMTVTQPSNLLLPTSGRLATTDQAETLALKELNKPTLIVWGTYADDVAAAAGGVPIGGIYDVAGVLHVRKA